MSQTKLYVGNLSYDTTSEGLTDRFSTFGEIAELKLITDRDTGRSKGFAFVTYTSSEAADEAAKEMNGVELDGRTLKVSPAKEERRGEGRSFGRPQNRYNNDFGGRNNGRAKRF